MTLPTPEFTVSKKETKRSRVGTPWFRNRFRAGLAWSGLLALAFFLALHRDVAAAGDDSFEAVEDVPSPLLTGIDERGALWTIGRGGHIENSGNKLITQAQNLRIDDVEFKPEKALKSTTVPRWILAQRIGDLDVNRDIYFDRDRGGVRYVDTFRNLGDEEIKMIVSYNNTFRYPWFKLFTAEGREFEEKLGARDTGVFVKMSEERENQGVLFLLTGERSSHKPGIEIEGDSQISVSYTLTIPPEGVLALAGWVVQSQVAESSEIKELRDEFYRQRLLTDAVISKEMRGAIVNFDMTNGGVGEAEPHNEKMLVALNELSDRIGVIRTGQDLLWVAKESKLSGELESGPVKCTSRFGEIDAELADLAAIQGGGGRGRQHKVFFRDGTVVQTDLGIEPLRLKGAEGWELELDVTQIEYLFGRIAEVDGKLDSEVNLFVRLHSGDVCGIAAKKEDVLHFMAPWGPFEVPLGHIESMSYVKSPSPRYRLRLMDGSRITAFLVDSPMRLDAMRFGEIELRASEISGMWTATGEVPEMRDEIVEIEDIGEFDKAACLFKGENLIAGRLVNEVLHLVSGTTVTTLKPAEIVSITRTYEEESEVLPVFEFELKGGDILVGTLREDSLRIEAEHLAWNVPVPHFIGMRNPAAKD